MDVPPAEALRVTAAPALWNAVVMAWWDFLDICEELLPDEPTTE